MCQFNSVVPVVFCCVAITSTGMGGSLVAFVLAVTLGVPRARLGLVDTTAFILVEN